jgi:putative endonuclease
MYYVYILKSKKKEGATYIGYTSDLKSRLNEHNSTSKKHHSSKYVPWEVETYLAFTDKVDAERFELYLKSSSGKAFMRKRLISNHFKEALRRFNNGRGIKDKRS